MANSCLSRSSTTVAFCLRPSRNLLHPQYVKQYRRFLQKSNKKTPLKSPSFAFAFDIDGVLLRSSEPLPRAYHALSYLQTHRIPFILLTNGGGKAEEERVQQLSQLLKVPLDASMFVQSHTPFAELANGHGEGNLKDKCILVVGGEGETCRKIAEGYGFNNVIIPSDLITAYPDLWPFVSLDHHKPFAKPLTHNADTELPAQSHPIPKIDAIMVFNDSRDWGLDLQLILDLILSTRGHLGTYSIKNNLANLANCGYQQEGQPEIYFSNPDLFWASSYHLPRLGQGGFQAALVGIFNALSRGFRNRPRLRTKVFGKPTQETFAFAESRLIEHRKSLQGGAGGPLRTVYMVGDNPKSDIKGANAFQSPTGSQWRSILVRTGVYNSRHKPEHGPNTIVKDVWEAVSYGLKKEGVDVKELRRFRPPKIP